MSGSRLARAFTGRLSPLQVPCGPFAGIPFTCSPMVVVSHLEPQIIGVLLCRRDWCPPLSAHFCRCGRPVDVCGHHRSVCGRAGVGVGTSRAPSWQSSNSQCSERFCTFVAKSQRGLQISGDWGGSQHCQSPTVVCVALWLATW